MTPKCLLHDVKAWHTANPAQPVETQHNTCNGSAQICTELHIQVVDEVTDGWTLLSVKGYAKAVRAGILLFEKDLSTKDMHSRSDFYHTYMGSLQIIWNYYGMGWLGVDSGGQTKDT